MVKRGALKSKLHLSALGLVLTMSASLQGAQLDQPSLVPIDLGAALLERTIILY